MTSQHTLRIVLGITRITRTLRLLNLLHPWRLPRAFHPRASRAWLAPMGLLLVLMGNTALAQQAGAVSLDVIDRVTGRSLPVYLHQGQYWVEARPNINYGLKVHNRSSSRVLAVMSVDGVNVLTGETASANQAGYVLGPWQNSQINGWRKSDSQVAAFNFTALPSAYATRTGRPQDVGVIGIAVFDEVPPSITFYSGESQAPTAAAEAEARLGTQAQRKSTSDELNKSDKSESIRLGTGHGKREYSPTTNTTFERASQQPVAVVQVRYDSRANLIAMGVLPKPRNRPTAPSAFPADGGGYVPDPPAWR